jgi:hypothetical protein
MNVAPLALNKHQGQNHGLHGYHGWVHRESAHETHELREWKRAISKIFASFRSLPAVAGVSWAEEWRIEFFAFLFAFIRVFRGHYPWRRQPLKSVFAPEKSRLLTAVQIFP